MEPEDYSAILKFVDDYGLKYDNNSADTIQYTNNGDGSAQISFSLNSIERHVHKLSDSLVICRVTGLLNVGAPLMKGSSITTIVGEISSGQVESKSGRKIGLFPFKSGIIATRVTIETIKKLKGE